MIERKWQDLHLQLIIPTRTYSVITPMPGLYVYALIALCKDLQRAACVLWCISHY